MLTGLILLALLITSTGSFINNIQPAPAASGSGAAAAGGRLITADVVALDQEIIYNRLGAINPVGTIYALRRDVVHKDRDPSINGKTEGESGVTLEKGHVALRADKRPRPLTLRMNVGDRLQVHFQNLLNPTALTRPGPFGGSAEQAATKTVGFHAAGMQLVNSIADDGSFVGKNPSSLAAPGENRIYTFYAEHEGTFIIDSPVDEVSLESVGTIATGLFGAIDVEPTGAEWYRSQVTQKEMAWASTGTTPGGQPIIDYDAVYPAEAGPDKAGLPIINMLSNGEIVHSDLTAIITGPNRGNFVGDEPDGGWYPVNPAYPNRNEPYREYTIVFHDEIAVIQPFALFEDPAFKFTLHSVRDAFAMNYGTASIGGEIIANRLQVGPMWDSVESKYEEFFLSSWVVGDPAMVVDIPANAPDWAHPQPGQKATKAFYPDDPSNVYHSYLNDHVKFRNVHIGREHHMFHLHAHQWLFTPDEDDSTYLDVQGLGPGGNYTYEITYNGSGNRNKTVGDSIFHCHFYPHFAMGMWGLWRVHDVFERGTELDSAGRPVPGARALPDGEIEKGTPIPGLVPIPGLAMAPVPGAVKIVAGSTLTPKLPGGQIVVTEADANHDGKPDRNVGYPLFIAGVAGHRPPTAPLDLIDDGGLPRHVVIDGTAEKPITPTNFEAILKTAVAQFLPETGTPAERAAMDYHAQLFHPSYNPDGTPASPGFETNGLPPAPGAPYADPARTDDGKPIATNREWRGADIQFDMIINKKGWHFPQARIVTIWGDVNDVLTGKKPPEPFNIRADSRDVINYYHTNLVPGVYAQDAFQVRTPTDVLGQHIHLVKFDVTASDGSANGFNYEDATMGPDEVRERITAIKASPVDSIGLPPGVTRASLAPKPHPFFGATGPNGENWLGARTTIQRWYADPLVNNAGTDRTLGNVFTHDHLSPSTHQQVGLYGALLIEPFGSRWRNPETGVYLGGANVAPRTISANNFTGTDGGPTSWHMDIITKEDLGGGPTNNFDKQSFREFYFAFADFQHAYEKGRGGTLRNPIPDPAGAINPPGLEEIGLPKIFAKPAAFAQPGAPGTPEAIASDDVGTYCVNYRNEPLVLRIRNPNTNKQADGNAGDLSLAFASDVARADADMNKAPSEWPIAPLTPGVLQGDPITPMMRVYQNDKVRIRTVVGAHEEGHNASIHGIKWRQEFASPNSGYRNSQAMGIAEQFSFDAPIPVNTSFVYGASDYLYMMGSSVDDIWNGTWGILRAYAGLRSDLKPLPNNPTAGSPTVTNSGDFIDMAPRSAQERAYDVSAVLARDILPGGTLVYNPRNETLHDPTAILYVRTADLVLDSSGKPTGLKPGVSVEPLVLRAAAGERITLTLRNRLPAIVPDLDGFNVLPPLITGIDGVNEEAGFNANDVRPSSRIGLHSQLVAYNIQTSDGAKIGFNNDQTIPPGGVKTYTWYAGETLYNSNTQKLQATPIELGSINLMSTDRIKHSNKGAIGMLVIEPQGAAWSEDAGSRTSATVSYVLNGAQKTFREFTLAIQDDLNLRRGAGLGSPLPFIAAIEDSEDSGNKALNYRTEPLWFRLGIPPEALPAVVQTFDFTRAFSNSLVGGDPVTPVFVAGAGEELRLRILEPGGHARNHVFALHGHVWEREPYEDGSTKLGTNPFSQWRGTQDGIGPTTHYDILPKNGAGGKFGIQGDYLYRDMQADNLYQGVWGILRVTEPTPTATPTPTPTRTPTRIPTRTPTRIW